MSGLVPGRQETRQGGHLRPLNALDLLGQLRNLRGNARLGQDHVAHLDGLFVVRDHRLGELDVGLVERLRHAAGTRGIRRTAHVFGAAAEDGDEAEHCGRDHWAEPAARGITRAID